MMINSLIENDFFIKACLAGIGISVIAGPLGSVMVWRRMAYFGDTLAHSTLLGVALAVMLNVNVYFGLLGVCLFVSVMLLSFTKDSYLAHDTVLSILSNDILAIGLIVATKIEYIRFDLLGYFYGDILAVDKQDIYWIFGVAIGVLLILAKLWRWLLLITLHEDLAKVAGVPVEIVKWIFVFLMALVFAVTMRLLGMLLIVALFVIPVSSARRLVKTPEMMAFLGSIFSGISVLLGVFLSLYYDLPTGPSIVIVATIIFFMSLSKKLAN
jgi:zinc transport system permease protein